MNGANDSANSKGSAGNAGDAEEVPPFFRTWPRVYAAVMAYLALLVAAFYFITRLFS